jgi:hypothetical protein
MEAGNWKLETGHWKLVGTELYQFPVSAFQFPFSGFQFSVPLLQQSNDAIENPVSHRALRLEGEFLIRSNLAGDLTQL